MASGLRIVRTASRPICSETSFLLFLSIRPAGTKRLNHQMQKGVLDRDIIAGRSQETEAD